jgi:hypothetical protein
MTNHVSGLGVRGARRQRLHAFRRCKSHKICARCAAYFFSRSCNSCHCNVPTPQASEACEGSPIFTSGLATAPLTSPAPSRARASAPDRLAGRPTPFPHSHVLARAPYDLATRGRKGERYYYRCMGWKNKNPSASSTHSSPPVRQRTSKVQPRGVTSLAAVGGKRYSNSPSPSNPPLAGLTTR